MKRKIARGKAAMGGLSLACRCSVVVVLWNLSWLDS